MSRLGPLTCVLFLAFALPLLAAETTDTQPAEPDEVTVVVTAERVLQPVSESIATATVITADEIRKAGAQTVADALRIAPGVNIRQSGSEGALATVTIRGSSSNQVLVLVDGQRLSSPAFFGGTDLSKFPVNNIARIEIIRGPASSLYGSEAFGGVINIITKKGGSGGDATLGFGGDGRGARSLGVRGTARQLNWQFDGTFPEFGGVRPNSDFAATDFSGRLALPDLGGWSLALRGDRYNDKLGLPSPDPNHTGLFDPDDRQWWYRQETDLTASRPIGSGNLELSAYRNRQQLHNLAPGPYGTFDSLITGTTKAAEALYHGKAGAHQWAIGGEYRDDRYDDIETGAAPSTQHNDITNRAVFLQDRWAVREKTDLVLGARLDDHSAAGSKVTPRVGITQLLASDTHLRVSYAEGFRAPNFVELYYPIGPYGPGYGGNPHLKPETSRQYEVGVNRHWQRSDVDLAAFTTEVSNLIMATSATPYQNVGRARQRGIELNWQHRLSAASSLDLSYTYLEAKNSTTGARLVGQARNKAALTASKRVKSWDASLTGRFVDSRPDLVFDPVSFTSKQVTLPSFVTFDLSLARRSSASVQPYVVVRNLLNSRYEEIAGFPTERRRIEAGVRTTW